MDEVRKSRPSIANVAAAAGVSAMTVSRVLNRHPSIRPATRERVLVAIAQLGYTPNRAARELASRRSERIGVIVDSAVEYGPGSTLRGIEEAAHAAGYAVSSISIGGAHASSAAEAIDAILGQGVDALCVIAPRASSIDVLRDAHQGAPTVLLSSKSDETFLTADVDQDRGAHLAVEHLVALGHSDIVHIAGPADWLDAAARADAYRAAMLDAGLEPRIPWRGDWSADSGYAFAAAATVDFTAVFAANDQIALGLIHGLVDRGLRVPQDVSVVGFDDIPESRHFLPPLTTIRQDFGALGVRAVETVLAVLHHERTVADTHIAPTIVERASTAPPARS
jgi:DNA-binding LacI/PurR family transcriptional regulator